MITVSRNVHIVTIPLLSNAFYMLRLRFLIVPFGYVSIIVFHFPMEFENVLFSQFSFQKAVLEPAMQGRDMIGRARTGTGKTLAFGIPILDKIIQFNAKHGFVFLILVNFHPTRSSPC